MREIFLIGCLLVATVLPSEARHRHWHWHGLYLRAPGYAAYGYAPRGLQRGRWERNVSPADIVPPGWQPQPADPNWKGKRFVSPDGSSWLAVYSFPTENEHIAFEYPTILKGRMDPIVSRAAAIINLAENDGCDAATSSIN